MFTGIIETLGTLSSINMTPNGGRLEISIAPSAESFKNISIGESVAVNGICLTVEKINGSLITVFASEETFKRTTLPLWKNGRHLNLERALRLDSRLGGHLVSGHIDSVGVLKSVSNYDDSRIYTFDCPMEHISFIIEKGSVAVDGISLTTFNITESSFSVSAIPHSVESTNLQFLSINDKVNLETDIIGKYVSRFLNNMSSKSGNFSPKKNDDEKIMELLKNNGFIE